MHPLTLNDLLKFNEFVPGVPIDITSDGNWIAYNTQNREQYEGGGGNTAYSKTGVMVEMAHATVWVTNTRTGEHRNLTQDWDRVGDQDGLRREHISRFTQIGRVSLIYMSGTENLMTCRCSHLKSFIHSTDLRYQNGHQMDVLFFSNPFLQQICLLTMNLSQTSRKPCLKLNMNRPLSKFGTLPKDCFKNKRIHRNRKTSDLQEKNLGEGIETWLSLIRRRAKYSR